MKSWILEREELNGYGRHLRLFCPFQDSLLGSVCQARSIHIRQLKICRVRFNNAKRMIRRSHDKVGIRTNTSSSRSIHLLRVPSNDLGLQRQLTGPRSRQTRLHAITHLITRLCFVFLQHRFLSRVQVVEITTKAGLHRFPVRICRIHATNALIRVVCILNSSHCVRVPLRINGTRVPNVQRRVRRLLTAFIVRVGSRFQVAYVPLKDHRLLRQVFIPWSTHVARYTSTTLNTRADAQRCSRILRFPLLSFVGMERVWRRYSDYSVGGGGWVLGDLVVRVGSMLLPFMGLR